MDQSAETSVLVLAYELASGTVGEKVHGEGSELEEFQGGTV